MINLIQFVIKVIPKQFTRIFSNQTNLQCRSIKINISIKACFSDVRMYTFLFSHVFKLANLSITEYTVQTFESGRSSKMKKLKNPICSKNVPGGVELRQCNWSQDKLVSSKNDFLLSSQRKQFYFSVFCPVAHLE